MTTIKGAVHVYESDFGQVEISDEVAEKVILPENFKATWFSRLFRPNQYRAYIEAHVYEELLNKQIRYVFETSGNMPKKIRRFTP